MAIFLEDTFTEASSTALGSHTPNTGGTWVQRNVSSGGTTRDMTVGGGTGTVTAPSGNALFTNSATPAGTDHYGEAVWTPSGASFFTIVFNWISEGNFYTAQIDRYNNVVYFEKYVSWSISYPQAGEAISLPNGTPGTIRYECTVEGSGKRLKLYFDGVEKMNLVDPSPISGVGLTGIQMDGGACTSIKAEDLGPDGYTLALDAGSYSISGQAVTTTATRTVGLNSSSYSISGQDVTFTYEQPGNTTIVLEPGSYLFEGSNVLRAITLSLDSGTYTIAGQNLEFIRTFPMAYTITLDSASYVWSGRSVALRYSGAPVVDTKQTSLSISIRMGL